MAIKTFTAKSRWAGGLKVDNTVREFTIRMDEPAGLGGEDTGMTPMEAQLSSLGSCLTIVAAAFAKKYRIDLQEFWIELEGDLDPDGYMKGNPDLRKGFQEIRVIPHIKTSSSEKDVEDFLAFVKSRCPITDNVSNETKIVTVEPTFI